MPITYKPVQYVPVTATPVQTIPQSVGSTGKPPKWEDGRVWHSIKEASPILIQYCGDGYKCDNLAQRIRRGHFQEGYHFRRIGRAIEVNIYRIING